MKKKLLDFITKIPKSDLHVHLDGSVRIETLIDLSKQHKLPLPSFTVEGLHELVFKDQYANLVEYLQGFGYVLPTMQTPESLEQISYEFAMDNINEGVCYVEVRFAPQLHINENQDLDQILLSVNKGLNKAKTQYNQRPEVGSKELPEFNYGIIVCAMRFFGTGYSKFYNKFLEIHHHSNLDSIFAMASYGLAKACVHIRDKYNIPIVALDIAGAEAGNPPIHHKKAYHFAHKNFMYTTVHAGEAYGAESIYQAVTELYTNRIGHGFYLFSKDKISDPKIQNKDAYIKQLVQYIANTRTTIEVCLTSNIQTIPTLKNIEDHPFAKMLDNNLSTTICTDNRTVSKTNVTKEIMLAMQHFNLTRTTLEDLIVCGFKKSFYPGTYNEKRNYIKQIVERYKLLEKQYEETLKNT
ncbi:adenosine deaminase [Gammaproteobacteria bacterium]